MDYQEFMQRIDSLRGREVVSRTGKRYVNIKVIGGEICFNRADAEDKYKVYKLNLEDLYKFYKGGIITTTEARNYFPGKQSPAVAFALAVDC